jgi:hypothetical protein
MGGQLRINLSCAPRTCRVIRPPTGQARGGRGGQGGPGEIFAQVAGMFAGPSPRRRASLLGLSQPERKNGWTIAELAGD